MSTKTKQLLELLATATQYASTKANWETKYDAIFPEISGKVCAVDPTFQPKLPKTSYEEDVRAYLLALHTHIVG